ncbi:MAG: hypothetical protein R3F37_03600 [Candidatus Competibacteraceae bacterium]
MVALSSGFLRTLLLVIILGSVGMVLLPELPGDAHLALQSLWLTGVLVVLTWQILRLLGNQMHLICARLGWRTSKRPPTMCGRCSTTTPNVSSAPHGRVGLCRAQSD